MARILVSVGIVWIFTIFIFMQNKNQKFNSGKNESQLLIE